MPVLATWTRTSSGAVMRIVFMGTPEFAVPSLKALARSHDVTLVVTRPDAVRGRGRKLEQSPVKRVALELGITVLETKRVDADVVERVRAQKPDCICVAAFGALLPDELLEIPVFDTVNVHASLLPHGRGAAPIQRAVLEGDEVAGVSIMRIVHALDAGPYCRQASVEIGEKPCSQVMDELAELGAKELVSALAQIQSDEAVWVDQDDSLATYAAKIEKHEMLLDPTDDAIVNRRRVQASLDAAPARAIVAQRGVRVMDARASSNTVDPGVALVRKGRVFLGCADGSLELLVVKPDGKRQMEARAWAGGLRGSDLSWSRA